MFNLDFIIGIVDAVLVTAYPTPRGLRRRADRIMKNIDRAKTENERIALADAAFSLYEEARELEEDG